MPKPTVRRPLPCAKCGYDIEGLSVPGHCPECGHPILDSIEAAIDPAASALAPAGSPERRTAWALQFACAGLVLVLAVGLRGALRVLLGFTSAGFARPEGFAERVDARFGPPLETIGLVLALCGAAAGLVGLAFVLPAGRSRAQRRARHLGGAGFAVIAALLLLPEVRGAVMLLSVPIAMVLVGISPAFRDIGARSKVYRTRRSAKQQIHVLLVAAGVAVCAALGGETLSRAEPGSKVAEFGEILFLVAGTSAVLLGIGLVYLAANAWWVLQAVLRPPPRLEELVEHSEDLDR